MSYKVFKVLITVVIVSIVYFLLSYALLDGRFIYETSFYSYNKLDSQKKNLFVTDKLNIKVNGDSLKLLLEDIDLWSEKHFVVTYYGVVFNKTNEMKHQRKIMMRFKNNKQTDFICYNLIYKNDTIQYSTGFPDNSYGVNINDTLIYDVYNCKNGHGNRKLGKLYIKIK